MLCLLRVSSGRRPPAQASSVYNFGRLSQDRQLLDGRHLFKRARTPIEVVFKLPAKFFHNGNRRQGGSVAQRTKRPSQHVLRQILDIIDVPTEPASAMKPG